MDTQEEKVGEEMIKKQSKYRNKKTEVDGILFDSKKEAKRYQELKLMEKAGEINALATQMRFDFMVNGVNLGFYKADFVYWDMFKDEQVVEDVKGMKTAVYRIKKKLMRAIHGINILET